MKTIASSILVVGLVGCMDGPSETGTLRIEPSELTVTVIDGVPKAQAYRATFIDPDGDVHDVTAETTFVLADSAFGSWTDGVLAVDGGEVGQTRALASYGTERAEAAVTVFARINLPELRLGRAPAQFDAAKTSASCAPEISYPLPGAVLPLNHGALDVEWTDSRDDLFEVSFSTTYLDVRLYTKNAASKLPESMWNRLAREGEPTRVQVNGMIEASPATSCASSARRYFVTDQALDGTVHYWSQTGLWQHAGESLASAPTPMIMSSSAATLANTTSSTPAPVSCFGCALSNNGQRLAMPSDQGGLIYDFQTRQLVAATDGGNAQAWWFSTFNATGTKLVTSFRGDLTLMSDTGTKLRTVNYPENLEASDPQMSPDGNWLANIELTGYSQNDGSSIVVRRYEDATSSFGTRMTIVPLTPGQANYNLAWSPDGQWLAFTRATGWNGTLSASIWVVKVDGSAPVQITAPTTNIDTAARWARDVNTFGSDSRRLYYLTFTKGETRHQLWSVPFYPDVAVEGGVPMGPAFRMPFQAAETDNKILQWTK